jgi:two-component system NtrC family response regulator
MVASNVDLDQLVAEQRMARDFCERLGYHVIRIPPLRARRRDIPLLVEHFLERWSRRDSQPTKALTTDALRLLLHDEWPGNVRQLQNVLEAVWVRCEGTTIEAADIARALPPWNGRGQSLGMNDDQKAALIRAIEEQGLKGATEAHEREAIQYLLATCPSLREAAQRAGISLSTLQYKMRKHGLSFPHHTNDGRRNHSSGQ